jgi:hypothetical protein
MGLIFLARCDVDGLVDTSILWKESFKCIVARGEKACVICLDSFVWGLGF